MRKKAINKAPADNQVNPGGAVAEKERKRQALSYHQGLSWSGDDDAPQPGDVIDLSGKKPWGRKNKGWAAKAGKLGDLDPQETDQLAWVNTWSILQEGPNGAGPVRDENYGGARPRTQTRQKERFKHYNPEFQDVADEGDWTSAYWSPDV